MSDDKETSKLLKLIFPVWLGVVFCVWLILLLKGPGFALFESYWMYSLMMVFGATVAGYTPEGGGAVAYPILSLYFNITPTIARDFSLAIQAVGMVSAGIYILTRKKRPIKTYRALPIYIVLSMGGFIFGSELLQSVPLKVFQTIFVALALGFILSFWITRIHGTFENIEPKSLANKVQALLFCFFGGIASSMFGTGSDMLVYILLSVYFGVKEKLGTDVSIILMGLVSLLGISYRLLVQQDVAPEVFSMWMAAVPVVVLFAPFGNMLLKRLSKEKMLVFVLILNGFNFCYWMFRNPGLIVWSILALVLFLSVFSGAILRRTRSKD